MTLTETTPQVDDWIDRFGGKLVIVLLDNKRKPSTRDGRSLWGMFKTLTYRPGDMTHSIEVPKGFVTDLASIPRWGWIILPPDGPWVKAAIIHDYLYATGGTGVWKGNERSIDRPGDYTRKEADEILREAMENRGVGPIRRTIIYLAVRIGASFGWRKPKPQTLDDDAERQARAG